MSEMSHVSYNVSCNAGMLQSFLLFSDKSLTDYLLVKIAVLRCSPVTKKSNISSHLRCWNLQMSDTRPLHMINRWWKSLMMNFLSTLRYCHHWSIYLTLFLNFWPEEDCQLIPVKTRLTATMLLYPDSTMRGRITDSTRHSFTERQTFQLICQGKAPPVQYRHLRSPALIHCLTDVYLLKWDTLPHSALCAGSTHFSLPVLTQRYNKVWSVERQRTHHRLPWGFIWDSKGSLIRLEM